MRGRDAREEGRCNEVIGSDKREMRGEEVMIGSDIGDGMRGREVGEKRVSDVGTEMRVVATIMTLAA